MTIITPINGDSFSSDGTGLLDNAQSHTPFIDYGSSLTHHKAKQIKLPKNIAKGFIIYGDNTNDYSGDSVSSAGDVNGDGLDDLIIGAWRSGVNGHAADDTGKSYVVFGKTDGVIIHLSAILRSSNTSGFVINGVNTGDQSGFSVSSAGDVNGDGLDDLIVGSNGSDPAGLNSAGQSFVVFGKTSGTAVNLSDIAPISGAGTGGFVINGENKNDVSGRSVSSAGDVNGDGLDDLIIGAALADPDGKIESGKSFVVFGKKGGAAINLSDIDSVSATVTGGFVINGEKVGNYSGWSVSSAGDVNGDGLADLIVGAPYATYAGKINAGKSFVVFGKTSGTAVNLSDIVARKGGFVINGENIGDHSGHSVSSAGDVNGDGLDDLIVGALYADSNLSNIGKSYVVFGKKSGTAVNLSDIDSNEESSVSTDLKQWAIVATTRNQNQHPPIVYSAHQATGEPDTGLIVGNDGMYSEKAWRGSNSSNQTSSTLTLGYNKSVYIKEVIVRETLNPGAISKLEVMKDGVFITVYSKSDDHQYGGTMSGLRAHTTSDTRIVLDSTLGYLSNQIRLTVGNIGSQIDAVRLIGSTSFDTAVAGGFVINGEEEGALSGASVSSAGDVNGDGLADLIVGSYAASPSGIAWAGKSYVVFGQKGGTAINLVDVANGNGGFVINGYQSHSFSGTSVSSAGDVNGDGLDDLIVGTGGADNDAGKVGAGQSFVIFGKTDTASINLKDIRQGGIAGHAINFKGNDSNETFTGSKADELFVAGEGNDTLIGNGGNDTFNAGAGDDTVVINADNLAKLNSDTLSHHLLTSVNGGNGDDILKLAGSHLTLDLTTIGNDRIQGIETIDLVASSNNTLRLNAYNLLNLSNESNILKVTGDSSNIVRAIGFSYSGVTKVADGITYAVYSHTDVPAAVLWVQQGLRFPPTLSTLPTTLINAESRIALTLTFDQNITGLTSGIDNKIFRASTVGITSVWSGTDNTNTRTLYSDIEYRESGEISIDSVALKNALVAHVKDAAGNAFVYMANEGNIPNIDLPVSQGFVINGEKMGGLSGTSVSSAGDVNGDGLDDFIINAPGRPVPNAIDKTYVVFGKTNGGAVDLSIIAQRWNTTDAGGFTISGKKIYDPYEQSGFAISSAGDMNGDGLDDLIIGVVSESPDDEYIMVGRSYVVFGKDDGTPVNLANIPSSSAGFVINGENNMDFSGTSVASAGDVNGDGLDDLIIGANAASSTDATGAGKSYVVFGKKNSTDIDLSTIAPSSNTDGFVINGEKIDDNSGFSVSSAGDVNGDGLDDLIIGAIDADYNEKDNTGKSYVVFGKASGAAVNLSSLSSSSGFVINGTKTNDYSGVSVSSAGDVNGDGLDDLIVGVQGADSIEESNANGADSVEKKNTGKAYVIFGKKHNTDINLADINPTSGIGTGGFVINGEHAYEELGYLVSSAGDVNGDGLDDVIVGTRGSYRAFVIFGTTSSAAINVADIGTSGFAISCKKAEDHSALSVSAAGDINGDGLDDLIVGAKNMGFERMINVGRSFVVFGKQDSLSVDLTEVDRYGVSAHQVDFQGDANSNILTGTASNELFVAGANNDSLTGNGGADVFNAGAGDDTITINIDNIAQLKGNTLISNLLASVNGGRGNDTLNLIGDFIDGVELDLTAIDNNRIQGIETINMTGNSNLKLNLQDLLALSDETNTLRITGDNTNNSINAIGFSHSSITQSDDGISYTVYHHSDASPDANVALLVQMGIHATL